MAKRKPHLNKSPIEKTFEAYRDRLYVPKNGHTDEYHEVRKTQKGYEVVIHKERGADKILTFDNEEKLNAYLVNFKKWR